MTDRVFPSAKPATDAGANNPATFPPTKAQLYNARRPIYRPQMPPRRSYHRRGCCCRCCIWTTAVILITIVLAALAGGVFYLIYRPHRPWLSVNDLQLSRFNLTDTSAISSSFNISVTVHNPNSRITIIYDQATVQLFSGNVDVGDGSFPGFTQGTRNATNLRAILTSWTNNAGSDLSALQSSVRKKNLPVKIQMDTKIRARIGSVRTGKLGIRVTCDGITVAIPSGKTATSASTSNIKCKLDPRMKIFRWTV